MRKGLVKFALVYNVYVNCVINNVAQDGSKIYFDDGEIHIAAPWCQISTEGTHTLTAAMMDDSNTYPFLNFYVKWDDGSSGYINSSTITVIKGGQVSVRYGSGGTALDPLIIMWLPLAALIGIGVGFLVYISTRSKKSRRKKR